MNRRKYFLISLLLAFVLLLTGCQESNESKYNRAQKLLSDGKYEEAIKVFDEISTYEDASKMSMYAKAIQAGENGDYETAYSGFTMLGEYKDCQMMIVYYTGRQYESMASISYWQPWINAASTYDTIQLFLDSKERAESCRKSIYDGAVSLAGEEKYTESIVMLDALGKYGDSSSLSKYYSAFKLEQDGKVFEASKAFAALGSFKDSSKQVDEVLKRCYDKASSLEASGDQEGAYDLFSYLGEYSDSYDRANKPYYDLGFSLRDEKKWNEAIAAFKKIGNYKDSIEQIKETQYQQACTMEESGDQQGAYKLFKSLGKYSDSYERAYKPYYDLGIASMEKHEWETALEAFSFAENYSDAKERMKEVKYQQAAEMEENGDIASAAAAFKALGSYKDSSDRANKDYYSIGVEKCKGHEWNEAVDAFNKAGDYSDAKTQISATRYAEGMFKLENKDWDGAIEAFEKCKTYEDAETQIKEVKYQEAKYLCEKGDYASAYKLFRRLLDYKDVAGIIENDSNLLAIDINLKERITPFRTKGNVVLFGKYEKDNNSSNGAEDIEWIVIDVQGEKCLLISKYLLDSIRYNENNRGGGRNLPWESWEKSTAREWLNNEFLQTAFSEQEQMAILITTLDNSKSQGFGEDRADGGNNTTDRIFLLSYQEAFIKYFHNDRDRMTAPTPYAKARGSWANKDYLNSDNLPSGTWWLRSPLSKIEERIVSIDGSLSYCHVNPKNSNVSIRPALWLDLESDAFVQAQ